MNRVLCLLCVPWAMARPARKPTQQSRCIGSRQVQRMPCIRHVVHVLGGSVSAILVSGCLCPWGPLTFHADGSKVLETSGTKHMVIIHGPTLLSAISVSGSQIEHAASLGEMAIPRVGTIRCRNYASWNGAGDRIAFWGRLIRPLDHDRNRDQLLLILAEVSRHGELSHCDVIARFSAESGAAGCWLRSDGEAVVCLV